MQAAERKRLVDVLRRGQTVLIGNRMIQRESDLPEADPVVSPPVIGELILDDEETDDGPQADPAAPEPRGSGRGGGDS